MVFRPVTIDLDRALKRVCGDRELLAGIIAIVIEDAPKLLDELDAALAVQRYTCVERVAHSIRGLVSNVHCEAAQQAASDVERFAQGQSANDLAHAVKTLRRLSTRMIAALEKTHRQFDRRPI